MRLDSIKIQNYKSYIDSEEIQLLPGFNVIVGKNNSGKTAFTETASLDFENMPHKSLKTKPDERTLINQTSQACIAYSIDKEELIFILKNRDTMFSIMRTSNGDANTEINRFLSFLEKNPRINFRLEVTGQQDWKKNLLGLGSYTNEKGLAIRFDNDNLVHEGSVREITKKDHYLPKIVQNRLLSRIYSFKAERLKVGQCEEGSSLKLNPDASNLPEVLRNLKATQSHEFSEVLRYFRMIFPEIQDINIQRYSDENTIKIFLSQRPSSERRDDLDIALQDSGTGVGQVLAILYVVVTARHPQIFVIDEPQSFLHPDAVRKLFSILSKYFSEHQYIITTHSASALSAANPSTIIQLKKDESETLVTSLDKENSQDLSALLMDLGVRASDVFGSDAILWVEGKTEEVCFPNIVQKKCEKPLMGNTILSVVHKSKLETKKKKQLDTIIEIYKKLNHASTLLPPALGFLFDKENLTDLEIEDFERRSGGLIHFIPRRMYENYLLHPEAIAALIASLDDFETSIEEIEKFINGRKTEDEEQWLISVDGAKLLDDLFRELSGSQHNYKDHKVKYGNQLTNWLLDNVPSKLDEISEILDQLLSTL